MNKLGFYIENTTVQFLRDALREVKPPTILLHAGDRGLLRDIRHDLSPNSFVVGRLFVDLQQQAAWLDDADPEARGRAFADTIINFDFGLALETAANGRLLIDAWMSLNEVLPGPASFANEAVSEEFKRRAHALDRFQVAFRERLHNRGLDAVAFNFGAGNYTKPEHYIKWFPRTLETYRYLGVHEYGWPTLMEDPSRGTATSALFYRRCMEGIRQSFGDQHRVIVTEAGLARMYKYPQGSAGDVGWLYPSDTISEEDYWKSLRWYNDELLKDAYMLGACLFQVGHSGRWESFRHLGNDNQQRPILIISKIATLNEEMPPEPPEPPEPPAIDLPALQRQIADLVTSLQTAEQLTAALPSQVARIDQSLDRLAPAGAQGATLPVDLDRLSLRLDHIEAELDRLQSTGQASPSTVAGLRGRIAGARAAIVSLRPGAEQAATLEARMQQVRSDLDPLVAAAAQSTALHRQIEPLLADAQKLAVDAGPPPPERAAMPPMSDARAPLLPPRSGPQEARALRHVFPTREFKTITRIVVHHTMTRSDVTPERLAQMHVAQGVPGIRYHYLVNGDGTIHWTQPLSAVLPQTTLKEVNEEGVAVALAGNFSKTVPAELQLQGAAQIIAYLLDELGLDIDVAVGRSEVDSGVISPGTQWLQGVVFKDTLMDLVQAIRAGAV